MKQIVCRVNLFDARQTVYVLDDVKEDDVKTFQIDTPELGKQIAGLCDTYDVFDVYLDAQKDYALNKIVPDIDINSGAKFAEKTINVHIKEN